MKSRNMVFEAVKRGKMMMPLKWHRCLREGPHARVSTRVCTRAPRLYGNCGQAAKVSYHTVYYLTADYDRRNCNYPASRIVSYERERERKRERASPFYPSLAKRLFVIFRRTMPTGILFFIVEDSTKVYLQLSIWTLYENEKLLVEEENQWISIIWNFNYTECLSSVSDINYLFPDVLIREQCLSKTEKSSITSRHFILVMQHWNIEIFEK